MLNKTISLSIALAHTADQLGMDRMSYNPFSELFKEEETDANYFISVDKRLVMSITQHESPDMSDVILKMTKFGYKVIEESGAFKVAYGEDSTIVNRMDGNCLKFLEEAFPNPHIRHFGTVALTDDILPGAHISSIMFMNDTGYIVTMTEVNFDDKEKNDYEEISEEMMKSLISGSALRQKLSEHLADRPDLHARLRSFA